MARRKLLCRANLVESEVFAGRRLVVAGILERDRERHDQHGDGVLELVEVVEHLALSAGVEEVVATPMCLAIKLASTDAERLELFCEF